MKVMRQLNKFAAGSAAVAIAAIASVGIAQADGMPSRGRAVVYEKPTNWSGFYFGAHSGWQWSEFDASSLVGGVSLFDVSHDSPVVGGQIGIQHQFGNFVLGVEGTLTVAFQDDHASTDCPNPAFTCAARFDDVITIGPRLGWAMGKWMPYLTGGYANAAFDQKVSLKANSANPFSDRERHSGWYIGGGVDMAVSHGWTIGLEYRHYDFDDAAYQVTRTLAGNNQVGVIDLSQPGNRADVTSDIVTLRASWKFGRPEAAPLK
jgi:outer membrane immunogenic protein